MNTKEETTLRVVLRADGSRLDLDGPLAIGEVSKLIGADCISTVLLADGKHVMVVDDIGHDKGLPINTAATYLYWDKCGGQVDHVIVGDVVIVPDADYAPEALQ